MAAIKRIYKHFFHFPFKTQSIANFASTALGNTAAHQVQGRPTVGQHLKCRPISDYNIKYSLHQWKRWNDITRENARDNTTCTFSPGPKHSSTTTANLLPIGTTQHECQRCTREETKSLEGRNRQHLHQNTTVRRPQEQDRLHSCLWCPLRALSGGNQNYNIARSPSKSTEERRSKTTGITKFPTVSLPIPSYTLNMLYRRHQISAGRESDAFQVVGVTNSTTSVVINGR